MNTMQLKGNWNVVKGKLKQNLPISPTTIFVTSRAKKMNCWDVFSNGPAGRGKKWNAFSTSRVVASQLTLAKRNEHET
jgi:hypothetical protein